MQLPHPSPPATFWRCALLCCAFCLSSVKAGKATLPRRCAAAMRFLRSEWPNTEHPHCALHKRQDASIILKPWVTWHQITTDVLVIVWLRGYIERNVVVQWIRFTPSRFHVSACHKADMLELYKRACLRAYVEDHVCVEMFYIQHIKPICFLLLNEINFKTSNSRAFLCLQEDITPSLWPDFQRWISDIEKNTVSPGNIIIIFEFLAKFNTGAQLHNDLNWSFCA